MLPDQTPTLLTLKQFSVKHPAFSEGSLRWMIFKAGNPEASPFDDHSKDLNIALVRIGRRVLIDEGLFFQWLAQQQEST